ncbi:MAG: hypothetical protein K2X43_06210 [Hyphomonadaceae bacterium]|jgi:hypothetical protein|nr:hypothetical protein [Hyphomonadaceae bacterium]
MIIAVRTERRQASPRGARRRRVHAEEVYADVHDTRGRFRAAPNARARQKLRERARLMPVPPSRRSLGVAHASNSGVARTSMSRLALAPETAGVQAGSLQVCAKLGKIAAVVR